MATMKLQVVWHKDEEQWNILIFNEDGTHDELEYCQAHGEPVDIEIGDQLANLLRIDNMEIMTDDGPKKAPTPRENMEIGFGAIVPLILKLRDEGKI